MARQKGLIKLSGQIGDIVFYGNFAKKAANKETYNHSENSKKASTEFGRASTASTALKNGFFLQLGKPAYRKVIDRIRSIMIRVMNTGPAAIKGERGIEDGDISLLKEFQFNAYTSVEKMIRIVPVVKVDPAPHARVVTMTLPKFQIAECITSAPKASAILLEFTCCSFNFKEKKGRYTSAADLLLPLSKKTFAGASLEFPLDDTKNNVIIVAMGVAFVHETNYVMMNRDWYGCKIIEAVYIREGKIVPFIYPAPAETTVPTVPEKKIQWIINEDDEENNT